MLFNCYVKKGYRDMAIHSIVNKFTITKQKMVRKAQLLLKYLGKKSVLSNNEFKAKTDFQKKGEQLEKIYGYRLEIIGV